eukprot:scaffold1410_cov386-Prasinococcus_capsulatus_cf.AAC.17
MVERALSVAYERSEAWTLTRAADINGPVPVLGPGGLLQDSGFNVATLNGVVIAYAISGGPIAPAQDEALLYLDFPGTSGELLSGNVLVSDPQGAQVDAGYINSPAEACTFLGLTDSCPDVEQGDGNLDGMINVLDVVEMILTNSVPEDSCVFSAMDMNSAGDLDILDVIAVRILTLVLRTSCLACTTGRRTSTR